jgi:GGDEF domain-containing protein
MTLERAKPIDLFKLQADVLCPGFLYSFNIADFKRRNSHLTHIAGDADIAELDRALKALASKTAVAARTHGDRWHLFSHRDESVRVQALLDDYNRSERIWTGWRIDGEKPGERALRERLVESEIRRAVRCLSAEVRTAEELSDAIAEIEKNDYQLPVDRIVPLADVPAMKREAWICVTQYPEPMPSCPFCDGRDFAWEDGDMSVYSGYGDCKACGAKIDIRQVS